MMDDYGLRYNVDWICETPSKPKMVSWGSVPIQLKINLLSGEGYQLQGRTHHLTIPLRVKRVPDYANTSENVWTSDGSQLEIHFGGTPPEPEYNWYHKVDGVWKQGQRYTKKNGI